jgi:hypothetical protein
MNHEVRESENPRHLHSTGIAAGTSDHIRNHDGYQSGHEDVISHLLPPGVWGAVPWSRRHLARGLVGPFCCPGLLPWSAATTTISAADIRANLEVGDFQGSDDLATWDKQTSLSSALIGLRFSRGDEVPLLDAGTVARERAVAVLDLASRGKERLICG